MNILSIDSSTNLASIAIAADDTIVAESLFRSDKALSARVLPEIEHMLAATGLTVNAIDLFACAVGPGSFTGVRAGVATIQGLALTTGKPCFGFSTLALVAMNFPLASLPVCPLLDARKNEVYAALYDCSSPLPSAIMADCVMGPEAFLDQLSAATQGPVIFAGDGAVRYREVIAAHLGERARFASTRHNVGHAGNGALLALHAWHNNATLEPARLLPVYLRPSEAEYAKLDRQKALSAK
ncbi:tRNA (adenosine(37)-N6)-threonylcarbamoyltransferase complex dimerization subunit type 1 TsaB [Geobacter sp. AOG2]|uniref:tRNA (adenosine(37)-N6)-threonylcarbamoyltransferase complex dimerization subunit type 1 TsaB n=1 Tax=Geobacter sp. AOG2 TaxID=1566347 RepID=UPI001CC5CD11|nr:tRNA (adenosine(37)-N6)-threonylcarbamoyltransferase complex dimerization subunit type 1 TsaB [Geobacter sp. AOG2]GFE61889.1 tRNA(adenosine(37)-N6)-threonylcarbamoyltransferase complex dimerization subunit type 1 TsaB [Geobacter sp. AOG2]